MDLSLQLIDELNPPAIPDSVEIDRILEAMKRDKKRTKHGQVWILPNAIGHVSMVNNIDHAALRETIDYIKHY
jgi:3-dehydroquinate synthase